MGANPWGRRYIPGQSAQRRRVLARDPVCTCPGCEKCTPTGCSRPSTEDDHLVPISQGGDSSTVVDDNHGGKCVPCHKHKSRKETEAARWALRPQRPSERHPGMID